jgi:hypothetical protein
MFLISKLESETYIGGEAAKLACKGHPAHWRKRHIIHDHKIDVILAATTQSPKNIIQSIS